MAETPLLPADAVESIERATAVLRAGGVIGFPTDTVYGLAADSRMASAIGELYALKFRDRQKAIPLLLGCIEALGSVAVEIPQIAWRLAERFWPGPLTMVVPKAATVLDVLTAGRGSVAVRVPAHEAALELITALGAPVAATSANLSGQAEAITADEVRAVFGTQLQLILDGGRCPGGVASTVVDVTVTPARIRRRGAVASEVEAFLAERM
jgi:L-threonylcarbamoyladenylate synthase